MIAPACACPAEREFFIQEGFDDLSAWEPVHFPGIKAHSRYSIETAGGENYLAALSNSSASGMAHRKEFRVYDYPRVRWRWKISNVYEKGDAGSKEGDDYPVRVYIMFRYDPGRASPWERIKYGLARRLYGSYPPASSLNYIWANRARPGRLLPNPYTEKSMMFVLESGASKAGLWVEEEVDVLADFRAAFGSDPPEYARLAVMNDSDNTGESSASYIDYMEVFRYLPGAQAD